MYNNNTWGVKIGLTATGIGGWEPYCCSLITGGLPENKTFIKVHKCQIDGEDFDNFCGLLRKHELSE